MKKEWIIGIFALIVVIVAVFYFSKGTNLEPGKMPIGDYNINIENFAYVPQELKISVGETVVWTNMDAVKHTVTSSDRTEIDSALLGQGESYSHTFSKAGTYEYYCMPHPYMTGKIIVE